MKLIGRDFDQDWHRAIFAEPVEPDAVLAERITLERVEYLAGERATHDDPTSAITCLDGPHADGTIPPRDAPGRATWPVRFRVSDDPDDPGEYLLAYIYAPNGVEVVDG